MKLKKRKNNETGDGYSKVYKHVYNIPKWLFYMVAAATKNDWHKTGLTSYKTLRDNFAWTYYQPQISTALPSTTSGMLTSVHRKQHRPSRGIDFQYP